MSPPTGTVPSAGAQNPPTAAGTIPGRPPAADGLTRDEARERLARFGYNQLPEASANPLLAFLSYFRGPIAAMIEVAALLSAIVRHWEDFWIILALLLMNAGVGFWEEYQAGNAIAALKSRLALQARVRRSGEWTVIPARKIVPGDLIRLRIGDIVPADAVLQPGDPIDVDQSALTGESLPVAHVAGDLVYSGSVVRQGESDATVSATGANTYFGRTAHLVEQGRTASHFQRAVLQIGDYLLAVAVVLVAIILVVALFRGDPMLTTLEFALVLAVASVPVAMPAVLSVTMAVGSRVLAAKEAIVSRLASIEELAGMDVLCADKTGTLTRNQLTLGAPFTVAGVTAAEVIEAGAWASRAEDQDTIDLAVLSGVTGVWPPPTGRITHFQPFDPVHKRTEATVTGGDGRVFATTKGAPQVILALSANAPDVQADAARAIEAFAAKGYRALGVARREGTGPWRFLGVLPLYDPPREDSRAMIETAGRMGIRLKMVTGDQMAIARETARQLGLGGNVLDASLFAGTSVHETGQLANRIEQADGFAQVFPEHKFHIVETLQQRGHIVGMTGDGVNDAPAIEKADAGIAVAGATDAARAAADIVPTTPGLSVIVDAIKESRKIFQRMTSYAIYRVTETIRVLLFMTLSILVFNFYPVTAVMIVLLALLNDGAILSIAYDRVQYSDRPEAWDMRVVLGVASVLGIAGVVASFGLFYLAERVWRFTPAMIQTFMYLKLSVAGHLTIFMTRTRKPFWASRPARILLLAVFGTQSLATVIAVYGFLMAPIGWSWALVVWGYALGWFLVNDQMKLFAYRLFARA